MKAAGRGLTETLPFDLVRIRDSKASKVLKNRSRDEAESGATRERKKQKRSEKVIISNFFSYCWRLVFRNASGRRYACEPQSLLLCC